MEAQSFETVVREQAGVAGGELVEEFEHHVLLAGPRIGEHQIEVVDVDDTGRRRAVVLVSVLAAEQRAAATAVGLW